MTEVTPQQAMEHHVRAARAQLSDGALVQGTLEHLWRLAYAAGVRSGQQAALRGSSLGPPLAALAEAARSQTAAEAGGWTYGSPGFVLKPGLRFIYGGTDQEKPTCERLATTSAYIGGKFRMELADTSERVQVPAMCWVKLLPEEA